MSSKPYHFAMTTPSTPATEDELRVKEKQTIEKKQELLKCLQNQVDEVDRNVADLAKSFDSLYEELCRHFKESEINVLPPEKDKDDEHIHNSPKTQESIHHLIQNANNVAKKKVQTIWSVRKLIHFIHGDREEICADQALKGYKASYIDSYLDCCSTFDGKDDTLIELLEEQNKRLQEKYKLAREHVKIVSEREKIVNEDRNLLRDLLTKQKSKMENRSTTTSMHDGCNASKQACDQENVERDCTTAVTTLSKHMSTASVKATPLDRDEKDSNGVCTELLEAKREISRLEATLQTVNTAKDGIENALVFGDVVEIAFVHTRDVFSYYPEKHMEGLLKTAMTNSGFLCDLKVVPGSNITKQGGVSLICCAAIGSTEWDKAFEKAKSHQIDYKSTFMLLFYEYISGGRECENAQKRNIEVLEKYARTFPIPHTADGKVCLSNRKALIDSIVNAIAMKAVCERKVIGCVHCKKTSSMV